MTAMLDAALALAARGWPVFPCHPETKQPLLGNDKDEHGNKIPNTGGLKKATSDPLRIKEWWKRWPDAMIGLPTGEPIGAFALDFDAGIDKDTGEVFEFDALHTAIEKEIGERLPETWAQRTPRGGRHKLYKMPEGLALGNRAGIVPRVDVRGTGGYIIVAPSVRADGKAYEWIVKPGMADEAEDAPPALVDFILRRGKWDPSNKVEAQPIGNAAHAAVRKYALAALDSEIRALEAAADGTRNDTLNIVSFKLAQLVAAGALTESVTRAAIEGVAKRWPNFQKSLGTIESGWNAGMQQPRDLREVEKKAEELASRRQPGSRGARVREPANVQTPVPDLRYEMSDPFDPDPHEPRNGELAGQWEPDEFGMPLKSPCPVRPLGIEGKTVWVLDSAGQLIDVGKGELNHDGIQRLFCATPHYPEWMSPRWSKGKTDKNGIVIEDPEIQSFKDDDVRKILYRACQRKGLFSARDKVRGRGAWRQENGALCYHAGDTLWIADAGTIEEIETGVHGDGATERVYPKMTPMQAPWDQPIESADNPARQLVELFRKWNFERPGVDEILLLGWVGCAFLGGALDWRSAVFLLGDKATGKSSLQRVIKDILGAALLDSADTSAAGIYQALGNDSRPVAVDELEGKSDNRKALAVLELARAASSGAFGRRGASDSRSHGVEFQMRSAFIFSAINNPGLMPQDWSRLAVLRLRPVVETIDPSELRVDQETVGRKILRQLMQNWYRFPQTLAAYKEQLAAGGHGGRGQDTYGTLLACADLMLDDQICEALEIPMCCEDLSPWAKLLRAEDLPEVEDARPNWRLCVSHLLNARVDAWRGGVRNTIGQLVQDMSAAESDNNFIELKYGKRFMAQAGLGIRSIEEHRAKIKSSDKLSAAEKAALSEQFQGATGWILEVPNQSPLVQQLFRDTQWQGAATAGVWSSALRQGPDHVIVKHAALNRFQLNGEQTRGTLIVLAAIDVENPRPLPAPNGRE